VLLSVAGERLKTDSHSPLPSMSLLPTKPFLKWAGGKRWLARTIESCLPPTYNRYFEPFLGGGAVFFNVAPHRAELSDINSELINAFVQMAQNVDGIIAGLEALRVNRSTYQRLRESRPTCMLERAIRFVFLNKTAFNGLYRVNKSGVFNVPYAGHQRRTLFSAAELQAASKLLAKCTISVRDFEESIAEAEAGDVIYCDPPYTVKHDNNGFIRYNEALFSWNDQQRLAVAAKKALRRGAHVIVSNARHASVRKLYPDFSARTVIRASCMSGAADYRGKVAEYLFVGDPGTT
jgi:DNA adenine methylase